MKKHINQVRTAGLEKHNSAMKIEQQVKERPILFSAPMVRAILDGRKTHTRRKVKGKSLDWLNESAFSPQLLVGEFYGSFPYGRPGDHLWVRETWRLKGHNLPIGYPYEYRATAWQDGTPTDTPWKPSIFMPRSASRILLEITGIRAERLQHISRNDAIAEGVEWDKCPTMLSKADIEHNINPNTISAVRTVDYIGGYKTLWQSINGPDSWEQNPWVWVIEFKHVEQ
jgi:hypothetical protein